ncbi:hypothetical protein MKX01_022929, partial [Papaver californicum]
MLCIDTCYAGSFVCFSCNLYEKLRIWYLANDLDPQVYKLPADRIYATYFDGDEKLGLEADKESRDIYENFWEMGDTGPCGPCTEIHFDRICNRDAFCWSTTTIQHALRYGILCLSREADGSLKPLPSKHVDTGMGFERLTSILNKMSNYDTDVFMPIFHAIQQATGARPYSGKVGADDVNKIDMAYRVVADILELFLLRLQMDLVQVKFVVELMGDVFPELKHHEVNIRNNIAEEETSFGKTLLKGIEKFKKAAQDLEGKVLTGQVNLTLDSLQDAFLLWDTYGFPLDLTQLMAEERGLLVDTKGFENAMEEARNRSRSAQTKQVGGAIVMDAGATSELHKRGVSPTDDNYKFIWNKDHESVVKAISNGAEYMNSANVGDEVGIIIETT